MVGNHWTLSDGRYNITIGHLVMVGSHWIFGDGR